MAKLYFHYSAMNAGKSTMLLQVAHNYLERKMHPYLLKPALDNRDGSDVISSRIGVSKKCDVFTPQENLFEKIQNKHSVQAIDCVLIDEAQFLSKEQVWQVAQVVDDLDIPVMAYGLRTDFRGELFPGSQALLAIADDLREIRTIDESGKKATMVLRFDEDGKVAQDGPQNLIGGNESYRSVTRKKWRELMNQ
ncbi:MAG: thymidine kinase [Patescibacteria group bacterium]